MQTNLNEILENKHLQMGMSEFMEAIARIADKLELGNLDNYFPEYLSMSQSLLDKKIECVSLYLMHTFLGEKEF